MAVITGAASLSSGVPLADTTSASFAAGVSYDTSVFRSGSQSLKIAPSSSVNFVSVRSNASILGYTGFYFYIQSLPTSAFRGIAGGVSSTTNVGLAVNSAGQIAWMGNGAIYAQTSALSLNSWHRVECLSTVSASGVATNDPLLMVDGVLYRATIGSPSVASLNMGHIIGAFESGNGYTVNFSDYLDSDTDFPSNILGGDWNIVNQLPVSDNRVGNWTGGAGGTTNLFEALNNTPPTGTTAAAETDTSQIKDVSSSTSGLTDYAVNMDSYSNITPSNATIHFLCYMISSGEEIRTGTKLIGLGINSNPTVVESTFAAGGDIDACGVWPTNWSFGAIQTGTSSGLFDRNATTVVGIGKRTATTRACDVCFLLGVVVYTLPVSSLPPTLTGLQAVPRASNW